MNEIWLHILTPPLKLDRFKKHSATLQGYLDKAEEHNFTQISSDEVQQQPGESQLGIWLKRGQNVRG